MNKLKVKPIIKWAGGKTQLLDVLNENIDNVENKEDYTYIEPFVGAGALFINVASRDIFKNYIINDINSKLINVYLEVRDNPDDLILKLEDFKTEYLKLNEEDKKVYYYSARSKYNEYALKENLSKTEKNILAAYFIFINKTCFNGLYRENKKGGFNVPIGSYKNPSIFSAQDIFNLSDILNMKDYEGNRRVKILNEDYTTLKKYIDSNTFVYFDPPYRPVTYGGFNTYDKNSFNDTSQIKLADFYRLLNDRNSKLMLSNSDPKNLDVNDDFFDNLYREFNIKRINARRSINSNGKERGKITELIIINYS